MNKRKRERVYWPRISICTKTRSRNREVLLFGRSDSREGNVGEIYYTKEIL
jgi:hypothetical protein